MNSKKIKGSYLISDIEPIRKVEKELSYFEREEIVLGRDIGTRLSVNLPDSNSFIYEGIKKRK